MKYRIFIILFLLTIITIGACSTPRGASDGQPESLERSPELELRDLPVDSDDLRILRRTQEILSVSSNWNPNDRGQCRDDETDQWSLFCALRKATIDVMGNYQHRKAALQEVRFAVEDYKPDREFRRRLIDFNNDESTHFEDIKAVLQMAAERVKGKLDEEY